MKRHNRRWCSYEYMIRVGGAAFAVLCVLITIVAAISAMWGNETSKREESISLPVSEPAAVVIVEQEEANFTETYEQRLEAEAWSGLEKPETVLPVVTEIPAEAVDTEGLICLGEFRVTAYCSCEKCCGIWAQNRPVDEDGNEIVYTASGAVAQEGVTIAVDPSVIPFGTNVVIDGDTYVAQDTGGAIKGNCVDMYFSSHEAACAWGLQKHDVFLAEVLK